MESQFSLKWYNAFKVISLILAILCCMSGISMLLMCLILGIFSQTIPAEYAGIISSLNPICIYMTIVCIVEIVILFLIFYGLKNFKKIGLYMIYTLNGFMPLMYLASIPIIKRYMIILIDFVMDNVNYRSIMQMETLSNLIDVIVPVSMVIGAVIAAGILLPNTIYFHKRRSLFN